MDQLIDNLARRIARGMSRREAARLLVRTAAASLLGSLRLTSVLAAQSPRRDLGPCGSCHAVDLRQHQRSLPCDNACAAGDLLAAADQEHSYRALRRFVSRRGYVAVGSPEAIVERSTITDVEALVTVPFVLYRNTRFTATLVRARRRSGGSDTLLIEYLDGQPTTGYTVDASTGQFTIAQFPNDISQLPASQSICDLAKDVTKEICKQLDKAKKVPATCTALAEELCLPLLETELGYFACVALLTNACLKKSKQLCEETLDRICNCVICLTKNCQHCAIDLSCVPNECPPFHVCDADSGICKLTCPEDLMPCDDPQDPRICCPQCEPGHESCQFGCCNPGEWCAGLHCCPINEDGRRWTECGASCCAPGSTCVNKSCVCQCQGDTVCLGSVCICPIEKPKRCGDDVHCCGDRDACCPNPNDPSQNECCAPGTYCSEGFCLPCPIGHLCPSGDSFFCCPGDTICVDGVCTCPSEKPQYCGDTCCSSEQRCVFNGAQYQCVDCAIPCPDGHCCEAGEMCCGNTCCPPGQTCSNGQCVTCAVSCPGGECCPAGYSCCSGACCPPGTSCSNGKCSADICINNPYPNAAYYCNGVCGCFLDNGETCCGNKYQKAWCCPPGTKCGDPTPLGGSFCDV